MGYYTGIYFPQQGVRFIAVNDGVDSLYSETNEKTLVLHRAHTMKATQNNFMCYTYKKRGKDVCSAHYLREPDLFRIVLDDLRRVTHFARQKERLFAEHINRKNSAELRREMNTRS